MSTAAIGTGSAADQLNQVVMTLKRCEDLRAVEYRWPKLVRTLESVVRRVSLIRARGGSSPAVAGPLAWMEQVVKDYPALQVPGAGPVAEELLAFVDRIRRVARS